MAWVNGAGAWSEILISELADLVCFSSLQGVNTQLLTCDVEERVLSHHCHLSAAAVPPVPRAWVQSLYDACATPKHIRPWDLEVSQSLNLVRQQS